MNEANQITLTVFARKYSLWDTRRGPIKALMITVPLVPRITEVADDNKKVKKSIPLVPSDILMEDIIHATAIELGFKAPRAGKFENSKKQGVRFTAWPLMEDLTPANPITFDASKPYFG